MPELDTKLDLGRIGSAELDLIIGRTVQKVMSPPDRMTLWRQLGAPIAKRVDFRGAATAAQAGLATPQAFFPFAAQPQVGRMWSVRKVVVLASSAGPFAAALANVTGVIFVTQGGSAASITSPPSNYDAEQTNFTIPTTQFYATHQMWVRGGEWLVVGVQGSGVVSTISFGGHAQVIEVDDSPEFLLTL